MNETVRQRTGRALTWLLAAATLLVAALLMVQCADIYAAGTSPANLTPGGVLIHSVYSREIIAEHFSRMAWSVWLWLALLAAVLVVGKPKGASALRAPAENRLAILRRRVEATQEMRGEQNRRRRIIAICVAACAVCAAAMALYMTNLDHFASRDLEETVGRMAIHTAPWAAAALAVIAVSEILCGASMEREIALAQKAEKRPPAPKKAEDGRAARILRIALYAAALVMLAAGVMNGGMRDVLVKAVNICTECIGLG